MNVNKRVAAACAGTVALTLSMASIAAPAMAASHRPAAQHKPVAKPAKTFKLHGVVVSVKGNKATVLVRNGVVNGKKVANKAQTVTVTKATKKHNTVKPARAHSQSRLMAAGSADAASIPVGSDIAAVGTTSGSTLTVTEETTKPVAAESIYGIVKSVSAGVVTLDTKDEARGDGEHADHNDTTFLDLNAATVNGDATNAATVKPGQYIVALGENDDHEMAVANASVFNTAPRVLIGDVVASDPATKTVTVASKDDHNNDGDESDDADAKDVTVDASAAQVVLNGNDEDQSATPTATTFPGVGSKVLVVAPAAPNASPTEPVKAALLFGFDAGDHSAVGENNDNQDEDQQAETGSSSD